MKKILIENENEIYYYIYTKGKYLSYYKVIKQGTRHSKIIKVKYIDMLNIILNMKK